MDMSYHTTTCLLDCFRLGRGGAAIRLAFISKQCTGPFLIYFSASINNSEQIFALRTEGSIRCYTKWRSQRYSIARFLEVSRSNFKFLAFLLKTFTVCKISAFINWISELTVSLLLRIWEKNLKTFSELKNQVSTKSILCKSWFLNDKAQWYRYQLRTDVRAFTVGDCPSPCLSYHTLLVLCLGSSLEAIK